MGQRRSTPSGCKERLRGAAKNNQMAASPNRNEVRKACCDNNAGQIEGRVFEGTGICSQGERWGFGLEVFFFF